MSFVLTLVGDDLSEDHLEVMSDALSGQPESHCWLEEGRAGDVFFDDVEPDAAEEIAREVLGELPLDLAAQAREGRRKRLLLADMESTIIEEEMLIEIAEAFDLGADIAQITERAMAGEIDFAQSLEARVSLLDGLPVEALEALGEAITLTPGARTLVQTMRQSGAFTALVSGGFTLFTERVAEAVGFHEQRANALESERGYLTGRLAGPIQGPEAKLAALHDFCAALHIERAEACAVGDGANDLPMLTEAGLGVAYHGKPVVVEQARYRVDHGDLTTLLFFQGYARADFRD